MHVIVSTGHGTRRTRSGGVITDPGVVNHTYRITEHHCAVEVVGWIYILLGGIEEIKLETIKDGTLEYKIAQINEKKPDLAVEVHFNAPRDQLRTDIRGTECLYYPGSVKGLEAAKCFQSNLWRVLGTRSRGVKPRKGLDFLSETHCPAVITEAEFLTNPIVAKELSEGWWLKGWWLRKIASAHVSALWELREIF